MRIGSKKNRGHSIGLSSLVLALVLGVTAVPVIAQDANALSQDVPEQTITFATVNPYTNAPGSMTITFSGVFHVAKQNEPTGSEVSRVTGGQKGTFVFVPDDSSLPTITGKFHFRLGGNPQPHSDTINFAFTMNGYTPDGSVVTFVQTERAVIIEGRADISFGRTDRVNSASGN